TTNTPPAGGTPRHRALYKPNPLTAQTAKEGVTRRVKEDAQLRKQRREELVSAKRFKRSKDSEEVATGGTGDEEVELGKEQLDSVQALLKSGNRGEKTEALKMLSDYLTTYSDSRALQAMVSSQEFLTMIE
ncbi:hypothetical protein BGZ58_005200, partial [Dissophora ornata]